MRPIDALLAVEAHKRRTRYTVGGCMAEICEIRTDEGSTRSLVVESEDPARVMAAVRPLGLDGRANVCMVRGLKALVGFGTVRGGVGLALERRHDHPQSGERGTDSSRGR